MPDNLIVPSWPEIARGHIPDWLDAMEEEERSRIDWLRVAGLTAAAIATAAAWYYMLRWMF